MSNLHIPKVRETVQNLRTPRGVSRVRRRPRSLNFLGLEMKEVNIQIISFKILLFVTVNLYKGKVPIILK